MQGAAARCTEAAHAAGGPTRRPQAEVGSNLLDVAIDNDVDIEGACGGTLACSTWCGAVAAAARLFLS